MQELKSICEGYKIMRIAYFLLILPFLFFTTPTGQSFSLWANPIEKETLYLSKEMLKILQSAKDCSLQTKGKNYIAKLCTGITLTAKDLNFFKGLDKRRCLDFTKQLGYQVFDFSALSEKQKSILDISPLKEMAQEFKKSTKLAYIDYSLKAVLFKVQANKGDCIHEVLHFYQYNRKSESELSVANRARLQTKMQKQLEKEISVVEKWEREKNKKKAMERARQLGPLIELQREWGKMNDWLHEKEVYQFMFVFYKDMGLELRDFDVAVTNLNKYKDTLDWRWQNKVNYSVQKLLNQKYDQVEISEKPDYTESALKILFEKGEISRDEFEKKVIGLRKYHAKKDFDKAQSLKDQLSALNRLREFNPSEQKKLSPSFELLLREKEDRLGLPFIHLNFGKYHLPFLVDLGAQQSLMPLAFFEKLKWDKKTLKARVVGTKLIQTGHGGKELSSLLKFKDKVVSGKSSFQGHEFAVIQNSLFNDFGILGIDFFRSFPGVWKWDFEKKVITYKVRQQRPEKAISLRDNGLPFFDALEYSCSRNKNIQIRIDTGSQVLGDYRDNLVLKESSSCLKDISTLEALPAHSLYFSRGVDINLGHPYLEKYYSSLLFNLTEGWIHWEEKGKS